MFSLLFITALIAVFMANAFALEIKLNTLYLTARVDGKTAQGTVGADQNSVVSQVMDGYGLNYDTVFLPTDSLKLEDGKVALYNTIVVEGASQQQLNQVKSQIEEYQKKYNIRVTYINCEPDAMHGFKQNGFNPIQTIAMRKVKLTKEGVELAHQFQMKGDDVVFNVEGCILRDPLVAGDCIQYHHYEIAVEEGGSSKVTPILTYLDYTNNQEIGAIAGAIIEHDGIQDIHFWISYIDSHIAFFVGHMWVSWANYGIIDGYRRLLMEIQIDDYFTDNCFQKSDCEGKREKDPSVHHYRTSVQDMVNIAQWHHDVSGRLPKGSEIKIELAINGIHILTETQHKIVGVFTDWEVPETTYGYVKSPTDPETHRWPQQIDLEWDDNFLQSEDPLYKHFKDTKNQDDFYWLTHTFTHLKLDAASYHDADMEMKANIKMSKEPYLGMYERECYSKHSIVTPEISGLHNSDNLKALAENEVYYAVGDTSRVDLNPGNFYFPFISNQTTSNFDGFVVFPRQPPQVYWDCSTIEENMQEYYQRYPDRTSVTWPQHLDEEADLHIRNFLKLRHDPYMFHEGNLRNEDFQPVTIGTATGKFGMMQQWVERMAVEINRYLDWPVKSIKMDKLAAVYIDRISRSKCKPEYTMVIDEKTGIIKEIKVQSTEDLGKLDIVGDYKAQCRVPLFAMRNTEFFKDLNDVEKEGDEPPTAWIVLDKPGQSKSFKFAKEVKYTDMDFVGNAVSGSGAGSFFSGYKLYIIIGVAVLLLLAVGYFIMGRGKKSGNSNYQNNSQYQNAQYQNAQFQNQFQPPKEPQKGYTQNMNSYNRDYRDTQRGPRSPNSYMSTQREYKNYRQLE